MKPYFAICIIIILGFAVYFNSFDGEFIYDDYSLVKNNIYIRDWSNVSKIFSEDMGEGSDTRYNYYRPFQILTYMIDYSFWKLNVKGYHLSNIILHILAAIVLYLFTTFLFNDPALSLFTSVMSVTHPIQTESVSYISCRSESLGLLFMLTSFIFYIKQLNSRPALLSIFLMTFCYLLALFSKETSLILPILLLLYHYTFKKKIKINIFLPIVASGIIYVLLREIVLRSSMFNILDFVTSFQRLPGFFDAVINYIRLLILPFHLHIEYADKIFRFTDPKVLIGVAVSAFLLIYAFRKRHSDNLVFFSISWFFISLVPTSNIYPPLPFYMAERWLYLPSIGFFLILGRSLANMYRINKFKNFTLILTTILLSFYSFLTIRQNNYWKEPISFYERSLEYAPRSPRLFTGLGNVYLDMGKYEKAILSYKEAIKVCPDFIDAYINLGSTCAFLGENKMAIWLFKKAIDINPDYGLAHNNLAMIYYLDGQYQLAVRHCDIALNLGYKVKPELLEFLKPYRK